MPDEIFFICDRCAERFSFEEELIEEDGLLYCRECYNKLLEGGEV